MRTKATAFAECRLRSWLLAFVVAATLPQQTDCQEQFFAG